MQFKWTKAPSAELIPNLKKYQERAIAAVAATGEYWGAGCQNAMRQSAPWEDRTGNARGGLFSVTDREGATRTVVYLGHTVYYGVFLELAHGKRYAVIMPTMERKLPELERMLAEIFRD
jgi:hypothetical protein